MSMYCFDTSWLPQLATRPATGLTSTAPNTDAKLDSQTSPLAHSAPLAPVGDAADGAAGGPSLMLPIGTSLAQAERTLILATLRHFRHHKERTAAVLGISLKTLYNRLKEYAADAVEGGPQQER